MMWTGGRRKTVGKWIGCLRYISGVRTKQYLLMVEKLAVVIFADDFFIFARQQNHGHVCYRLS